MREKGKEAVHVHVHTCTTICMYFDLLVQPSQPSFWNKM